MMGPRPLPSMHGSSSHPPADQRLGGSTGLARVERAKPGTSSLETCVPGSTRTKQRRAEQALARLQFAGVSMARFQGLSQQASPTFAPFWGAKMVLVSVVLASGDVSGRLLYMAAALPGSRFRQGWHVVKWKRLVAEIAASRP